MDYAIVVCATPNWLAPAAVTLLSCAQHGATKHADLILVSFDTKPSDITDLLAFNQKHQTNISLLDVSISELQGMGYGRLGVGSLLRLKLGDYLPTTYKRILYLDSDVLALGECHKLFTIPLQDQTFAAVENTALLPWIKRSSGEHLTMLGMDQTQKYFNAGVMLFDWQKVLKTKFMSKSLAAMKANPNWPFQDQDALNSVAQGHWKMLDHKWNVTKKTADYLNIKPIFRHFNGAAKPWNSKARFGLKKYYSYYIECLGGTPWQSFIEQPQKPWPLRDNWRAVLRKLSFRRIAKLKRHINLVAETD